ncbi:uncharacterized protein LOC144316161 [Canis aureus]
MRVLAARGRGPRSGIQVRSLSPSLDVSERRLAGDFVRRPSGEFLATFGGMPSLPGPSVHPLTSRFFNTFSSSVPRLPAQVLPAGCCWGQVSVRVRLVPPVTSWLWTTPFSVLSHEDVPGSRHGQQM